MAVVLILVLVLPWECATLVAIHAMAVVKALPKAKYKTAQKSRMILSKTQLDVMTIVELNAKLVVFRAAKIPVNMFVTADAEVIVI